MFTYNFNTDLQLSQVRLLIADTDSVNPIFQDAEINQFLYLESSQNLYVSGQAAPNGSALQIPPVPQVYSVYRAAALALDSMASNQSLLSAINQLLDVKLSTKDAAIALQAQAKQYRDTEAMGGSFAIAEMVHDQFTARERVYKTLLRLYGGG